jgi:fatty-acyl-CoA synthase
MNHLSYMGGLAMDFNWSWTLDFLGRRAAFSPQAPVLFEADRNRDYTYRDLEGRASKLAAFFTTTAGLRKGDRVAMLARNCVEYIDFLFAAIKTGVILVPLNVRLTAAELSEMLSQTTPRLLAYEHLFEEVVAGLEDGSVEKLLVLRKSRAKAELPAEDYDAVLSRMPASFSGITEISPADPLLILFTGGTTGPPKGAVISQRAVFFNMLSEALSWQLGPGTVVPNLLPFFHTGGWHIGTLPTLYAGGRVLINPAFDPELTLRQVADYRCSFIFAAATMYQMISGLDSFSRADLSSLQFVMSGAAPCPVSVMEPYWDKGAVFVQGYGITEGGPNNLFMPWYALSWEQVRAKNQSVGKPFLYCRARIAREDGADAAPGEMGELLLSGPVIFSGYWDKPADSDRTLRQGWVHTGDIARQDEDGFFYIVDRKKDMYISGGENVFPVEVEQVIAGHPRVLEAAVIGIPDPKWGEVGKAFVVLKPGADLEPEQLQGYLQERLARYKVPREVVFVDSIPKSGVGKVLKRELDDR